MNKAGMLCWVAVCLTARAGWVLDGVPEAAPAPDVEAIAAEAMASVVASVLATGTAAVAQGLAPDTDLGLSSGRQIVWDGGGAINDGDYDDGSSTYAFRDILTSEQRANEIYYTTVQRAEDANTVGGIDPVNLMLLEYFQGSDDRTVDRGDYLLAHTTTTRAETGVAYDADDIDGWIEAATNGLPRWIGEYRPAGGLPVLADEADGLALRLADNQTGLLAPDLLRATSGGHEGLTVLQVGYEGECTALRHAGFWLLSNREGDELVVKIETQSRMDNKPVLAIEGVQGIQVGAEDESPYLSIFHRLKLLDDDPDKSPITCVSTGKCVNLNVDMLDGYDSGVTESRTLTFVSEVDFANQTAITNTLVLRFVGGIYQGVE